MLIIDPEELRKYQADRRLWQGIPGVAVTRGGRVYASFYSGGTKEDYGNFCMLKMSDDLGRGFGDIIAVVDFGNDSCAFDPCLWIDPIGRLWWIINRKPHIINS